MLFSANESPRQAQPAERPTPPTPDPPAPESRSGLRKALEFTIGGSGLIVAIATVVGLVAVIPGLVYSVRPELRPDGPPPVRSVSISNATLEERGTICESTERQPCVRIGYEVEFTGYQRDELHVIWAAFDPETQTRVDLDVANAPEVGRDKVLAYVSSEAPSDRASHFFDVPIPDEGRCIFVRISIVDPKVAVSAATPRALDDPTQLVPTKLPLDGTAFSQPTPTPAPWPSRLDVTDTAPFHTHDPDVACSGQGGHYEAT
jgi:hypothetical protein